MGIQLLSISHKTAPAEVRARFAFQEQQRALILDQLVSAPEIKEAVILSTCSRTELYCSGDQDNRILKIMQNTIIEAAGAGGIAGIGGYILRYQGERAVHHLFLVTAGLDSVVLGEDQILGQVRQAYFESHSRGYCKADFNNLFRLAVTAAKKIKTDTVLSKSSVSTAGLALKKAEQCHGGLAGKKLLVIGGSGQIGSIVLKDAVAVKGLDVYAAIRKSLPAGLHNEDYTPIRYEERYLWMDQMDVIISATASPHYTVTRERFEQHRTIHKKRVFFDLAVPQDMEESLQELPDTDYYNMEDMQELARQNNERKQNSLPQAHEILREYEQQFYKHMLYSQNLQQIQAQKQFLLNEAQRCGLEKALDHFFIALREGAEVDELETFMRLLRRV